MLINNSKQNKALASRKFPFFYIYIRVTFHLHLFPLHFFVIFLLFLREAPDITAHFMSWKKSVSDCYEKSRLFFFKFI